MIYLITTSNNDGSFHRVKRSTEALPRKKRDTSAIEDILESIEKSGRKNGTNIRHLPLVSYKTDQSEDIPSLNSTPETASITVPVVTVLLIVIIALIVIFLVYRRKRRKRLENSSQEINIPSPALDSAAQNPICQRRMSRASLSLSRINVNVKEIKDSTVSQSESESTASVQLLTSNVNTRSSKKRHAGTEV